MNIGDIAFPNLGIYLKNVPRSFSVFGFQIAFYGLIIGVGVILSLLLVCHIAKKTGQNPDDYWDFAIYAVLFSLLGARIYYVIFSWDEYRNNLSDIFKVRNGGLAIYGGVIAGFLVPFQKEKGTFGGGYGHQRTDTRAGHRKMGELYEP